MARNRMKPNGKKLTTKEADAPKVKSDFISALEHGMAHCAPDFAKAIGVRARNLRAWKSGRGKPTPYQKETTIAEASKTGWKTLTNTNS